mmetsp:Transcript_19237/g.25341  ORF Transcript_19237/g.25341 Transcript_19237/m.25341 type:complete len:183 (+) Transcript_19237:201-749(+)
MGYRRNYSQLFYSNDETDPSRNRNTDWLSYPFVWAFYIFAIGLHWGFWYGPGFCSASTALTITNVINCCAQLYFIHWVKGVPDDFINQGEFNGWTLWEQIDAGIDWTPTKKFLAIVPLVLSLITCASCDYSALSLAINVPACAVVMIAKLPQLEHVRIFGINSTPGIDDSGQGQKESETKNK